MTITTAGEGKQATLWPCPVTLIAGFLGQTLSDTAGLWHTKWFNPICCETEQLFGTLSLWHLYISLFAELAFLMLEYWNILMVPRRGEHPLFSFSPGMQLLCGVCSHPKSCWEKHIINTSRGETWSSWFLPGCAVIRGKLNLLYREPRSGSKIFCITLSLSSYLHQLPPLRGRCSPGTQCCYRSWLLPIPWHDVVEK